MKYLLLSLTLLLFSGCKKSINLQSEELVGVWGSSLIEIDGNSASSLNLSNGIVFMVLNENGFYSHNFNSGNWEIDEDKLTLTGNDAIFRDYKIIHASADSIVVQTQLIESDYFIDLPDYDADEYFDAVEHLVRQ